MKIIVDMNLAPSWVECLAGEGFKADHWSTIGQPTAPDEDIVRYAAAAGAAIPTHDLDFPAILASTRSVQPSVLLLRGAAPTWSHFGATVCAAMRHFVQEINSGAVLVLGVDRVRVRVLPLRGGDGLGTGGGAIT